MEFIVLLKKIIGLLEDHKQIVDLLLNDEKSDRIKDQVDKCEKKSRIRSSAKNFTLLPDSAFQSAAAHLRNIE